MLLHPRLVTIPSTDTAFAEHAHDVLASLPTDLPQAVTLDLLQRELQELYPGAVVRARDDLAGYGTTELVWYVTHRSFRSRIATTLEIRAPRDYVFRTYVERVGEWQTAIRLRPRILTPDLTGSEWAIVWEFLGRRLEGVLRLVEADPPHAAHFEAQGMGIRVWYATSFSPSPTGTTMRVVGDYDLPDGVLPKIADRLFVERGIERQINGAHASLLALCARDMVAAAAS